MSSDLDFDTQLRRLSRALVDHADPPRDLDDIPVETDQFLPDVLATDTVIDDPYVDARKAVRQLLLKAARIAHRRGARPDTQG